MSEGWVMRGFGMSAGVAVRGLWHPVRVCCGVDCGLW